MPSVHVSHAVIPVLFAKEPTPQGTGSALPSGQYAPFWHGRQALALVAAVAGEYNPAAHLVQVRLLLAPVVSDQVPGGHPSKTIGVSAPTVAQ